MADADLDDFFAKKDKSKKKSKSKVPSGDVVGQTDEAKAAKKKKKKKDKEGKSGTQTAESDQQQREDDDEWNEFKETDADLSGLRIQNLQISTKEEDEEEREEEDEGSDEDGEGREKKDSGVQGPWKTQGQPAPPSQPSQALVAPEPAPVPEVPKEESKPAGTGGRYVPPAMRRAGGGETAPPQSTLTPTQQYLARKKKAAPNIQSEADFPTLGAGGCGSEDASGEWSGSGPKFEAVRGGGRGEDTSQKNVQLSLGNKYGALSNVES